MIAALALGLLAGAVSEGARTVTEALKASCISCHGPKKQKARLRLDEVEGLRSVITPGSLEASVLWQRASLPPEHEDVMPPTGEVLAPDQLAALRRWIESGAPVDELVGQRHADPDVALRAEVARASGARLYPVGADYSLLRIEFPYTEAAPSAASLAALAPLAERIHELGLAGTRAPAGTLAELPALPRLERAHLERTGLGDADVAMLVERAPNLRYLNLHSTAITDRRPFEGLASLERLVLYGTAADQARAEPGQPFAGGGPRRVLIAEHQRRLVLLRETALGSCEVVWERPGQPRNHWTDGSELLIESARVVEELDLATGRTLGSWTLPETPMGAERILRHDGRTLILAVAPPRIITWDPDEGEPSTAPLEGGQPGDVMFARPGPGAHILVGYEFRGLVAQHDPSGAIVRSYRTEAFGPRHLVVDAQLQDDGNWLIAGRPPSGESPTGLAVIEVDLDGRIVWSLSEEELPSLSLANLMGVQRLTSGNLMLSTFGDPNLIEVDPEKRVVWRLPAETLEAPAVWAHVIEDPYRWGPTEEPR